MERERERERKRERERERERESYNVQSSIQVMQEQLVLHKTCNVH